MFSVDFAFVIASKKVLESIEVARNINTTPLTGYISIPRLISNRKFGHINHTIVFSVFLLFSFTYFQ